MPRATLRQFVKITHKGYLLFLGNKGGIRMDYNIQQQGFYAFIEGPVSYGFLYLIAFLIGFVIIREFLRNKIVFRTIIIVLFIIPFTLIELCQWIRH